MLNILARKREEELSKAKAIKEATKKSRLVNVSVATSDPNLIEKKLEHDRLSAHYLQIDLGICATNPELNRQRQELADYYNEKRRSLLVKLLSALQLGADVHFTEQKKILWKEYQEEFLPHLLDTMCHIIIDNARIVFSIKPDVENRQLFSRMPNVEEGSLHETISINVAVYLEESMKRVQQLIEEQCARLTLRSMDIMTKTVLDIEEQWKKKTRRDVENFHRLKMQEMSYKLDEERDIMPASHWSENLVSPQHGRRAAKAKLELHLKEGGGSPTAEDDKYYLQAQRVKQNICDNIETTAHAIRLEQFCILDHAHNTSSVGQVTPGQEESNMTTGEEALEQSEDEAQKSLLEASSSSPLQSCYSNVAALRRMNLEANVFLQRMSSVSLNLQAECDALEHALSLEQYASYSADTASLEEYIFDDKKEESIA